VSVTRTILGDPTGVSTIQPADHGLNAWSYDPSLASTGQLLTNGTVYLSLLSFRQATTITRLWYLASTAGVTATAGQNWLGLYDFTGTLVASVGTDASVTAASTPVSGILAAPYNAAVGRYWVAVLANAATAPTLLRTNGATQGTNNAALSAAGYRFAINGTVRTTLAATITPSANAVGPSLWVGTS
jgi:hypothetical protein